MNFVGDDALSHFQTFFPSKLPMQARELGRLPFLALWIGEFVIVITEQLLAAINAELRVVLQPIKANLTDTPFPQFPVNRPDYITVVS